LAVKLRLRRMGKKKQPIYKVVAADARSPRDGKFLEAIGIYNPLTDPFTLEIKEDRALYWLNVGAQPTDTVKSLLSKKGILLRRDLTKRGVSEEKIQEQMDNWMKLHEAKAQSKTSKKEKSSAKEEVKESTAEVKGAASEESPAA
jgi:small subunit ribosomal protein S16